MKPVNGPAKDASKLLADELRLRLPLNQGDELTPSKLTAPPVRPLQRTRLPSGFGAPVRSTHDDPATSDPNGASLPSNHAQHTLLVMEDGQTYSTVIETAEQVAVAGKTKEERKGKLTDLLKNFRSRLHLHKENKDEKQAEAAAAPIQPSSTDSKVKLALTCEVNYAPTDGQLNITIKDLTNPSVRDNVSNLLKKARKVLGGKNPDTKMQQHIKNTLVMNLIEVLGNHMKELPIGFLRRAGNDTDLNIAYSSILDAIKSGQGNIQLEGFDLLNFGTLLKRLIADSVTASDSQYLSKLYENNKHLCEQTVQGRKSKDLTTDDLPRLDLKDAIASDPLPGILPFVFDFLKELATNYKKNTQMNPHALAIVLGPRLMPKTKETDVVKAASESDNFNVFIEALIYAAETPSTSD